MSKFAYHRIGTPSWLNELVKQGRFDWLKLLDPPAGHSSPFPGPKVIGRIYVPDGEANSLIWLGKRGAEEWYGRVSPKMLAASYVWCWELPNEPQPIENHAFRLELSIFTQRAAELMHADGLKAVVGCFSQGTPELQVADSESTAVQDLAPVFEVGDYLGLHEYGMSPMQQDAEWHCLRHRFLTAEMRRLGIRIPPILITEAGIDAPRGWKKFCNEEDYWAQLYWYDRELERDSDVLCFTPFTVGPTPDWDDFEITERLAVRMATAMSCRPAQSEPISAGIGEWLGDIGQSEIIPQNRNAALWKALYKAGASPISREYTRVQDSTTYVAQIGYDPSHDEQIVAWCKYGDWGNVKLARRKN